MTTTTAQYTVLAANDGLRLRSGPGRDLVFKVTGEDTGGAFDYFTVEVAPHGGPPLHVHHKPGGDDPRPERALQGQDRRGDLRTRSRRLAYLPSKVPHAFLNLTDAPAEIIVVYTPGGGHHFYEELGPATRNGTPDRAVVAAIFEKHDMSLLGPPLSDD